MAVFWDIAPCRVVEVHWRFRGVYCLHHQDDDGGAMCSSCGHGLLAYSSEKSVHMSEALFWYNKVTVNWLPLFITNFLWDHCFLVRLCSVLCLPYPQESQVPQDCILSVTLFAVAINGMENAVGPPVSTWLYQWCGRLLQFPENWYPQLPATDRYKLSVTLGSGDRIFFLHSQDPMCTLHLLEGIHPQSALSWISMPCRFLSLSSYFASFLTADACGSLICYGFTLNALSLRILKLLSRRSWGGDRMVMPRLYCLLVSAVSYIMAVSCMALPQSPNYLSQYLSTLQEYILLLAPPAPTVMRACRHNPENLHSPWWGTFSYVFMCETGSPALCSFTLCSFLPTLCYTTIQDFFDVCGKWCYILLCFGLWLLSVCETYFKTLKTIKKSFEQWLYLHLDVRSWRHVFGSCRPSYSTVRPATSCLWLYL
jgi:hypothetical protein